MKAASRLFYLSVFALWASPVTCSADTQSDDCPISSKSIVQDACASYATLEKLNNKVKPSIDDLTRSTDFFSHYRLNLFNKRCPFWDDESGFCGNIGCAVETLDNEEDVPEVWRAKELGKLEGPLAKHPGKRAKKQHPDRPLQGGLGDSVGESCVYEYDDECDERDYCVPEDESASSKGDYVSLLKNPERFTGYGGDGAKQVWDAIYRENCFQKSSFPSSANLGRLSQWAPGPAAQDFKHVLDAAGRQNQLEQQRLQHPNTPFVANTGFELDDECIEKRVFYRVMSGMHASISAHLCWDFLNQTTGKWQPNVACYVSRLHGFPDRISNLYFNYALVTRAVAKLGPHLQGKDYTFCTDDPLEDAATRAKVNAVTQQAASEPRIFDESLMFVNGEGPSLKEDFRNRFRNVSRLMDCVGCDKCRLWGKVQTNGYGTALKVLFEFAEGGSVDAQDVPPLKRTELVSLFNTYARLGESLKSIEKFRGMVAEEEMQKMLEGESAAKDTTGSRGASKDEDEDEEDELEDDGRTEEDEMMSRHSEDDLQEFIALRDGGPASDGLRDVFSHEIKKFLVAVKIVFNGWMRTPRVFWSILSHETGRLYRFWVGLPSGPRKWKFQFPDLTGREL